MSLLPAYLAPPFRPIDSLSYRRFARIAPLVTFHLTAFAIAVATETGIARIAMFVAAWGLLNFFWLALLRRPALSAALSLTILVALIFVSRFKFDVLWMAATFVDVMIIDADTFAFLWMMFPAVRLTTVVALILAVPIVFVFWK